MLKLSTKKNGQSLVEVIVALGVVVALALSLVTTSLLTQRTSRSASSNTQATKLAQQIIEQMRVFRDRIGFSALSNNTYYCIRNTNLDPQNWILEPIKINCPNSGLMTLGNVSFSPTLIIANGANVNQKTVKVTVTWTDSAGLQTVTNDTVLSNCVSTTTACP